MELRFKRIAKAASSQPATNVGGGKREGGGTRWRRALCVTKGTGEKSPLPPSPFYIGARGDVEKLDKKASAGDLCSAGRTACAVAEEEEGARAGGKLESSSFRRQGERHRDTPRSNSDKEGRAEGKNGDKPKTLEGSTAV